MKLIYSICLIIIISCSKPKNDQTDSSVEPRLKYVNSKSGLVIRKDPSISSLKVAVIPYGEFVKISGEPIGSTMTIDGISGKWIKVNWQNFNGFSFAPFLSDSMISKIRTVKLPAAIDGQYSAGVDCSGSTYSEYSMDLTLGNNRGILKYSGVSNKKCDEIESDGKISDGYNYSYTHIYDGPMVLNHTDNIVISFNNIKTITKFSTPCKDATETEKNETILKSFTFIPVECTDKSGTHFGLYSPVYAAGRIFIKK